jgi:hypothetical protein
MSTVGFSDCCDPWQDFKNITYLSERNLCERDLHEGLTGQGIYKDSNGAIYRGEFLNGRRHGEGICHYADGDFYQGGFLEGQCHGQGTYRYLSGTVYRGGLYLGKRHGRGSYKNANGEEYQGEFCHGKRHGKGIVIQTNGITREVSFFSGARMDSSQFELGDLPFVNILFGGKLGAEHGYALGIIASYLSNHLESENQGLVESLFEANKLYQMDSHEGSQRVYKSLQEGRSCLLPYGYQEHEMGLQLVPSEDGKFIYCKIFNSGEGLNFYHAQDNESGKYQTELKIKVPFCEITQLKIEKFLNRAGFKNLKECYGEILEIPQKEIIVPLSDEAVWQTSQKGDCCTLEWIFSFLKNNMSDDQYHALRRELFLACLEMAGETTKHLPSDVKIFTGLIPKIGKKLIKLQITPEEKIRVWTYGYSIRKEQRANGVLYQGECFYGIPDGEGFESNREGICRYVGAFFNGVYHGRGSYQYENGESYQGMFFNGAPHGFGVVHGIDGTIYEGDFFQGKPGGHGICKYANGDTYEGMFCDGMPHGQGIGRTVNGGVFDGRFLRGIFMDKDIFGQNALKLFI